MPQLDTLIPAMLARAADPEAARRGWERLQAAAPPAVRTALERAPRLAEAILAILASSEHLTEALVQSPELVLWLDEQRREPRGRTREDWTAALDGFLRDAGGGADAGARAENLTRFQRREYLRIVLRDLNGEALLAETTQELSHLADALLERAYAWAWNDLVERYGTPREASGAGAEMAVLGLGKLGGEELNYSSDIDLMFLYSGEGETAGGEEGTANREFFTRLAQRVTQSVSGMTSEGRAYRVDLRLRPGGREGELALGMASALEYYRTRAREWELQMLIRARGCAGSRPLAQRFLRGVAPWVYPAAPDPAVLASAVRESRERIRAQIERHRAVGRRSDALDVKLDAGGIREIEFLTQFLQRRYGGAEPWVRNGNTRVAMQRLHDKGWLGGSEFQALSSAYELLRHLEHRLQLRLGQQTHSVPREPERLAALARSLSRAEGGRLGLAEEGGARGLASGLEREIARRMDEVARLYGIYVGREPGPAPVAPGVAHAGPEDWQRDWQAGLDLSRHGRRQLERLLRSAATQPAAEAVLRAMPSERRRHIAWAMESGDAMADMLIRRPALAAHFDGPAPELETEAGGFARGMARIRRWSQQQTLAILWDEWQARRPIAATLARITGVAEGAIAAGLELAQEAVPQPAPSLAVLGLGRLGLGEMDLLSDLDLVFVAREPEREAASRVAAKWIEVLTAYTAEGGLYAVDTRLRPGGGEGELVQTPGTFSAYFRERAGAWEALSYLKARYIAGDRGLAAAALACIHEGLRQRFPRGAGAAELRALRDRIEREGHPGFWGLKTAPGGLFDVDFLVSNRRLQLGIWNGAGGLAAWARTLPPQALAPAAAAELAELTERLRAGDHALRVATGKAGAALPASGEGVERAQAWLDRMHPGPRSETLAVELAGVRARIRALYEENLVRAGKTEGQ